MPRIQFKNSVYIEMLPHDIADTWQPSTIPNEYSSLGGSTPYLITAFQIFITSTTTGASLILNDTNSLNLPANYIGSYGNLMYTKIKITSGTANTISMNFLGISFYLLAQYGVSII